MKRSKIESNNTDFHYIRFMDLKSVNMCGRTGEEQILYANEYRIQWYQPFLP